MRVRCSSTTAMPPTGNGATLNMTNPPSSQLNPNAPIDTATLPSIQVVRLYNSLLPCHCMLTLTRWFFCKQQWQKLPIQEIPLALWRWEVCSTEEVRSHTWFSLLKGVWSSLSTGPCKCLPGWDHGSGPTNWLRFLLGVCDRQNHLRRKWTHSHQHKSWFGSLKTNWSG